MSGLKKWIEFGSNIYSPTINILIIKHTITVINTLSRVINTAFMLFVFLKIFINAFSIWFIFGNIISFWYELEIIVQINIISNIELVARL
jgi:hypothetical protein